jgi:rhamnulokinase
VSLRKALVAVDLGAQSCRVSLLRWKNGGLEIRGVHRFSNAPVVSGKSLHWDIAGIFAGVEEGLRQCAEIATEGIASVGIDGWAVDYVRLDDRGQRLGDPFCYRDDRTTRAMREVFEIVPPKNLYKLTGIQIISLNTLFQLYADKIAGADAESRWLNLPEYITHLLGGRAVAEYTNATHTQLVSLGEQKWCGEIFRATGLALPAAPEIVRTGTFVGAIAGELSRLPAFRDTQLIVPACHDTASAIAAIPAVGDDWAFISSGTWSLVGTVLQRPCVSDAAREMNFTNLGGVGGTICFLKNVNGMWLLRQCMDEWAKAGQVWTLGELLHECERFPRPTFLIDVDDPQLMVPGDLPARINAQLTARGHAALTADRTGIPQMANLIFHSLAQRYAEVLDAVVKTTGKKLKRLFIVGGGARNEFLNRLTAERTGLDVHCGSSEASTIGNFAVQMAALSSGGEKQNGVGAAEVAQFAEALSSVPFSGFME